jgi:hypothetical protein
MLRPRRDQAASHASHMLATSPLCPACSAHPSPLPNRQGAILFLFGRTLYEELDVDGEMQKGSLPAALSLANKFVPATKAVVTRTVDALQVREESSAGIPALKAPCSCPTFTLPLAAFYPHPSQNFTTHLPEHASRAQQYLVPDESRQARSPAAGVQMAHMPRATEENGGLKQRRPAASAADE